MNDTFRKTQKYMMYADDYLSVYTNTRKRFSPRQFDMDRTTILVFRNFALHILKTD